MPISRPALMPSAYWPHLGGVEELTRQLAKHQRDVGMQPIVLTHRWPTSLPRKEMHEGQLVVRESFRVRLPQRRALAAYIASAPAVRAGVLRALYQSHSDLVHVQCVANNADYARRAAHRLRLPLVVSMQGELSMDATQIYQRSSVLRTSWQRLVTAADMVTGCSAFVVEEAERTFGQPFGARAQVIPNGVDLEEVSAAVPWRRRRPYVLGLGRLVPQKGFDLLVQAFAMMAGDRPDLELVIAGSGEQQATLVALSSALGVYDRVQFVGRLDRAATLAAFAGAAAFVLPSRHEPQGIVVLEAMASGTPLIAAAVGGVPEVVSDGVNGRTFPGGEAAALAAVLREVLASPDGAARRADRALIDVRAFSWPTVTRRYQEVYELATRRRRP